MNVSGIRPYEGFYQYNSIKLNELRNQQISAVQQSQEVNTQPVTEKEDTAAREQEIAAAREKQTFGFADYAKQYNPDETFDLKGVDSDLNSLDVEKAVSDLEKDQILQQYQYFVGNDLSNMQNQQPTSGTIHSGENFVL